MEESRKIVIILENGELTNSGIVADSKGNTTIIIGKKDRNIYDKFLDELSKRKEYVTIDLEELRKDKSEGSLYYAWQANIAMAFKDEFSRMKKEYSGDYSSDYFIHKVSNQAAKNFLDTLIKE